MAIQNLRSSDAHKRPIPTVLSAGQIAINTNEASPGLFFKDSNGDLVKVGPVHIGTSAPNSSPATTAADAIVSGTTYQILTVGTTDFTAIGASANTVGTVFTATGAGTGTGTVSGQQGNEKGEQWLDTTGGAYDLKIYDGSAWRSQAGEFVNHTGDTMTGVLEFVSGSASAPGIAFSGDANTGIYRPGADQVAITTGGVGRLFVDSNGDVKIEDTSADSAAGPEFSLYRNSASPADGDYLGQIRFDGENDTGGKKLYAKVTGKTSDVSAGSEDGLIETAVIKAGSQTIVSRQTGTDLKLINGTGLQVDGSVGIGTTAPSELLHLNGTNPFIQVEADSTTGNSGINFADGANKGQIMYHHDGDYMRFSTNGSSNERVRIDNAGHLLMGTTSSIETTPNAKISIVGDQAGPSFCLGRDDTSTSDGNDLGRIRFYSNDGGSYEEGARIAALADGTHASGDKPSRLAFYTSPSGSASPTERMRINSSGNVGIGTTSPSTQLDVITSSSAAVKIGSTNSASYGQLQMHSANQFLIGYGSTHSSQANHLSLKNNVGDITFFTNSSERVRIDSSGNVHVDGIFGTDTKALRLNEGGGLTVRNDDAGTYLAQAFQGGNSPSNRTIQLFMNGDATFAGNVGIGTTSASSKLHVYDGASGGTPSSNAKITIEDNGNAYLNLLVPSAYNCGVYFGDNDNNDVGYINYAHGTDSLAFGVNASERMRIDSSGSVGVGVVSPYAKLAVHDSVTSTTLSDPIAIFSGTSYTANGLYGIGFHYSADSSGTAPVFIGYEPTAGGGNTKGNLVFGTRDTTTAGDAPSKRMVIDSSGSVGIGTTSPARKLEVAGDMRLTGTSAGIYFNGNTNNPFIFVEDSEDLRIGTANTERMRIDSSGRLLVGATSSSATSNGTWTKLEINNLNLPTALDIARNDQSIGVGNTIGLIRFLNNDNSSFQECAQIQAVADGTFTNNDKPTRLVFSTTADDASSATERMRIDRNGLLRTVTTTHGVEAVTTQSAGTTYFLFRGHHSGTAGTPGSGTISFQVFSNGNTQNTNNSFTGISDIKLKENIVDASSQWNDIKSLQVRNYNFKAETNYETHTQIGVVAQEVEAISPGLVIETPDLDADNNDLGTTTKSVNYSVLYMKAVKALQEAMDRIETLEAKVAALEAG